MAASFAATPFALAQEQPQFQAPTTLEGAREGAVDIGDKIVGALPKVIARIWNNQMLPGWRQLGTWANEEIWQKRVKPAFQTVLDQTKTLLGQEVEKRKPIIEQELEKEKQELKEELERQGENAGKSIWERFKDLFRKN